MGSWSGAVCIASRTMLNSGRFVWNANAIHGQSERERSQGRWWSEYLKQAGYRTYMTGKWHCRANAEKLLTLREIFDLGCLKLLNSDTTDRCQMVLTRGRPLTLSLVAFGKAAHIGVRWWQTMEDFLDEAQTTILHSSCT